MNTIYELKSGSWFALRHGALGKELTTIQQAITFCGDGPINIYCKTEQARGIVQAVFQKEN